MNGENKNIEAVKLSDRLFYINVLKSESCQCERTKKRGQAFCYRCYSSLPKHVQNELWCAIGAGFEQAYDDALKVL